MDSFILTGPDGRVVNLGSYARPESVDFGSKDLLKAAYAQNAITEGGVLAYEDLPVRTFTIPMLLASSGAFAGGLTGLETLIRNLARPGAVIDLIPENVATTDAVRFDVLTGRLEEDYSIFHNRISRRTTTLKLDVQPVGYMPTLIVLASAASIGLPGVLTIPNASIMGDQPGLADIVVSPTSPTSYPLGTWPLDMIAWSLAGRASFQSFWPAPSLASWIAGSLIGDIFSPGSQALGVFPSPTVARWTKAAYIDIPASLEPAYRGRFRVFTLANLGASQALAWSLAADVVPQGIAQDAALASAGQVASIAPAVRGPMVAAASPAYSLVDLGEVTMPPVGSGAPQPLRVRLWTDVGGTNIGIASPMLKIGGVFFLPLDGPYGVLPRGLTVPTVAPVGSVGRFDLSGVRPDVFIGAATGDIGTYAPLSDARIHYRGVFPKVGGSTLRLELLAGHRRLGAHPYVIDEILSGPLLAYYRLVDIAGASELAPFPGYGPTGVATGASMAQVGPLWGGPSNAAVAFNGSNNSFGLPGTVGMPTSLSFFGIARRASAVASLQTVYGGGSAPQGWAIAYEANVLKFFLAGQVACAVGASYPNPDASHHSYGITIDGATAPFLIRGYFDGSVVASAQGGSWGGGTQGLYFAGHRGFPGSQSFPGLLGGEAALFATNVNATTMKRLHDSAFAPTGGATTPLIRAAEAFASVSVRYRPRFLFLKGV